MIRQRVRLQTSPLAYVGQLLVALLALALIWYGVMLILLATKVSPEHVNLISGYRSAYDYLAGLEPVDISGRVRLVAGLAGLAVCALCGFLAWKELPRPYLARSELAILEDELMTLTVEPRAIERVAETAAAGHRAVNSVAARYGEDLAVAVSLRKASDLTDTLREIRELVADALAQHELPALPISVTLTGFDRQQRRELQ